MCALGPEGGLCTICRPTGSFCSDEPAELAYDAAVAPPVDLRREDEGSWGTRVSVDCEKEDTLSCVNPLRTRLDDPAWPPSCVTAPSLLFCLDERLLHPSFLRRPRVGG